MHGSVLLIRDYFLSSCITWARLTDIGVGTGYYLKHAPAPHAISLMDLNPDSLKIAASRVGNTKIRATLQHDVFDTFPADWHGRFDSVSMYYLLHCLPGEMTTKAKAIKNASMALKPGGTLLAPRFWAKRSLIMLLARN